MTLALLLLLTLGVGARPAHADAEGRLTQRQAIDLWSTLESDAASASVEVTQAGEKLGVPPETLRQFFKILKSKQVPLVWVHNDLAQMAERHRHLVEILATLTDDGPAQALMNDARAALAKGDYDGTDAALATAEQLHLDLAQREAASVSGHNHRAARMRSERGRIAMIRRDHLGATRLFRGAINLARGADRQQLGAYNWLLAWALHELGVEKVDSDALLQAIATYRADLRETRDRERMPMDWASGQHRLGMVLAFLGVRRLEPAWLEEAVAAFRLALEEFTRERDPVKWAILQAHLGLALSRLGSYKVSTQLEEEAVATFRLVLQDQSRDQAPLRWAWAQRSLGEALVSLGRTEQRTPIPWKTGTMHFREALTAYRMALEETPREHEPWDWAAAQEAIGDVSMSLADSERRPTWLEEAVAAYGQALEEYTPDRAPRHWHRAQQSMESATTLLGFERRPLDGSPRAVPGR